MTEVDQKRINKFLRNKKYRGEVKGDFTFSLRWPIIFGINNHTNYVCSPNFKLCDADWKLKIFPQGLSDSGEYLSVFLVNLSEFDVYASYKITLLCNGEDDESVGQPDGGEVADGDTISHVSSSGYSKGASQRGAASLGKDIVFRDPERIVKFSKCSDGDNEWGSEDFVESATLHAEHSPYTCFDEITFRIDVEVFGRDDLNKEVLSSAVLGASETKEIMKIADEEVNEVVKKLPALRNSVAQKKQEDNIVKARAKK